MLIPIRCFTCGNLIADKYEKYLKLINEKSRNKQINELTDNKMKIFKELKLKRYCCRRMLLTNVDIIDKIKK